MDSPVEATASLALNARSVKTIVHPFTFGTRPVADLDVDEDLIAITTTADEEETHITGQIDANEDLEDVHVCAALFDDDHNVIAVGRDFSTTPPDIDEDESGTFDVSVDTSEIDVNDIDQFELWFDAIAHDGITAPVVVGPNDVSAAVHSTGELSPTVSGDGTFTTPDKAFSSNDDYATVTLNATGDPQSQVYRDYNIDDEVPDDSNIDGIAVRVDWKLNAIGDNSQIKVELSWNGGTNWTTAKTNSEGSTTEESVILGGSTDDWGHNWDTDELTNANFRVRITADADAAKTFSFDWIPVTVHYTE
jgi:hypothetical protein